MVRECSRARASLSSLAKRSLSNVARARRPRSPVYPYSGFESFKLTAPDVGHMHGCRAYAYADGDCARQATSSGLEGSLLQKWSAAAVDSMSTAPHHTDIGYCRDWFES